MNAEVFGQPGVGFGRAPLSDTEYRGRAQTRRRIAAIRETPYDRRTDRGAVRSARPVREQDAIAVEAGKVRAW